MKTQNKKAYVFSLSAWQTIRGVDEQLAGADLRITHMRRPFPRYRENVKKLIWQANRGKNKDSTRREVKKKKKRGIIFLGSTGKTRPLYV
jgi:hypothetical protein